MGAPQQLLTWEWKNTLTRGGIMLFTFTNWWNGRREHEMIGEKAKIFLDCLSWEWVQSSSQFLLSLGLGKVGGWAVFFSFFSFFFFFLFPVNSVLGCFPPPSQEKKLSQENPLFVALQKSMYVALICTYIGSCNLPGRCTTSQFHKYDISIEYLGKPRQWLFLFYMC